MSNKTKNFKPFIEAIQHSNENKQQKEQVLNILHKIFQSSIHGPKLTHPAKVLFINDIVQFEGCII